MIQRLLSHAIACMLLACSLASCEKTVDSVPPKKPETIITTQDIDLPEVEITGTYSVPYIPEYNSGPRGNTTVKDNGGGNGSGGGVGSNGGSSTSLYGIGELSLLQTGNSAMFMTKTIHSGEKEAILVVLAEFDSNTEEIKKTTVVARGSQIIAKMVQVGGGVSSYDPWTGLYSYTTYCQLEVGFPSLGPLLAGTIYEITGKFNPITKRYNMTIKVKL